MAASAADIGAEFSSYRGDKDLGGGNAGVIAINTNPLEQLAGYTFLANKTQWLQKKQETDNRVKELADLSSIALNNLRGKDKEEVAKQFSTLLQKASDYARKDPKTNEERLQAELEWQTEKGKFNNNYNSGKARALSYYTHLNTIKTDVTDAATQNEAIKQLNRTFDDTSIDTPISSVPKFKMQKFDISEPVTQKINTVGVLGNDNYNVILEAFNPKLNVGLADAAVLGITKSYIKKGTPEYNALSQNEKDQADIQSTMPSDGKGWVDATTPLNQVLKGYVRPDGTFDNAKFEDENSANTAVMNAYMAAKNLDQYSRQKYEEAKAGLFTDNGVSVKLPSNVNPDDYKAGFIDFSKGLQPNQLVMAGSFAKFKGDNVTKALIHTGEENDLTKSREAQLNALELKNRDEAGANYRAGLDLIGKGFSKNAKGKWVKPVATALTTANNGGVVPYWQNYIAPQISIPDLKIKTKEGGFLGFGQSTKENEVPANFTGDVEVSSDKLSGLSVALSGELNSEGKQKAYDNNSVTKIRFQNGTPVGVVIDDVFYDQNDINSKATRLQDKNVSNKFDSPVFGETTQPDNTTPQPATGELSDAQKYLNSLKNK